MKDSIIVLRLNTKLDSLFSKEMAHNLDLKFCDTSEEVFKICAEKNEKILLVVIGPGIKDPIQISQRISSIDKNLSLIIMANNNNIDSLKKSIQFTPFLNNYTICLPEEDLTSAFQEIGKLVEVTKKNRESKKVTDELNLKLETITSKKQHYLTERREYMERLFDAAPIGILTISSEGEVFGLNKAASEMLHSSESQSLGVKIQDYFPDLILVPDRIEEIEKKFNGVIETFEMTITTIIGKNNMKGYLILLLDITERKNYETKLEKAVKSRDEFLSVASHELKTPITSLKIQLQMMKRLIPENMQTDLLGKFSKSTLTSLNQVERLIKLVENLLDVSRIESGNIKYNFVDLDLVSFLQELMDRLRDQAEIAGCRLSLVAPPVAVISCDPFYIEQVFTNLLINAFKYASGGQVNIDIRKAEKGYNVLVQDEGMGIEEKKLGVIFKRFERAISNTNISGLGLGLYISKSIVDAHHGRLTVKSVPNQGTVFTVFLPSNPAAIH